MCCRPADLPATLILMGCGNMASKLVVSPQPVPQRYATGCRPAPPERCRSTATSLPGPPTSGPPLGRDPHPELFRADTHGMVDMSEDISSKDLVAAAHEGYDSVELAKRYTTATMGPSQGKLETVNTVAAIAEARGETISQVGTTVWRPPYAPLTLGRARRSQF